MGWWEILWLTFRIGPPLLKYIEIPYDKIKKYKKKKRKERKNNGHKDTQEDRNDKRTRHINT